MAQQQRHDIPQDTHEDEDDFDAYKGQKFDLIGFQDYLPFSMKSV